MDSSFLPMSLSPGSGEDVSLVSIVSLWIFRFNSARRTRQPAEAIAELLSADPWWRDHLALTCDLRTFRGADSILGFLGDTLAKAGCGPFVVVPDSVQLVRMGGKISFIYSSFTFDTKHAVCSAGLKLIQDEEKQWRAWNVYTRVEHLKGWTEDLRRLATTEAKIEEAYDAVIVGAGQAGLQLAVVLKTMGMRSIIVDQNMRLGDQWRMHYDSLRLHLPKQHSQFLYRPFPETMPLYPSKDDIADFLEHYSRSCHLSVLSSTRVTRARFDDEEKTWRLELAHRNGTKRRLQAGQLILATGILGASAKLPTIPGSGLYTGSILHSIQYKNGAPWKGKKAVVVGAGTSGHDIAEDLYRHGAQVLMVQRSPIAVVSKKLATVYFAQHYADGLSPDAVDRALESTPMFLNRELAMAAAPYMEQMDAALRAGLAKVGFLFRQPDAAEMLYDRFGGYYVDTGCSKLIIDRKIKLKTGCSIKSFRRDGLEFDDGTHISADVVVFTTGFDTGTMRALATDLVGPEIGEELADPWGVDEEGEVNAAWRDSGHPHLWYHGGDFKAARYYSKLLAVQILATKLGILERYQK